MSSVAEIRRKIVEEICVELGIPEQDVIGAKSLRRELHMDSVATANILFRLEAIFDVELNPSVVERIDAIADLEHVLSSAIGGSRDTGRGRT